MSGRKRGEKRARECVYLCKVSYHRLLPGQQLQFDEVTTKELSQVLAEDADRRLSQEDDLSLKPERLLRVWWLVVWKYPEGGARKAKACLINLRILTPTTHKRADNSPNTCKESRDLLLQACALQKLRLNLGDVPSAFLQTSASGDHQALTIKVPPEVGNLFPDSAGEPAR